MIDALPNLHAAILHLPIVLIPAAVIAETVSLAVSKSVVLDRVAAAVWSAAAAAALATFYAGRSAADGLIDVPPAAQGAISAHSDAAWWLVAGAMVVLGLRLASFLLSGTPRLGLRALCVLTGLGLMVQVVRTADRGGALVYRHRLAVDPVPVVECPKCAPPPGGASAASRWTIDADGSALWKPIQGDLLASDAVVERVGTLTEVPSPDTLTVQAAGPAMLLLPNTWGSAQMNARLDLSGFTGRIGLVHHLDSTGKIYGMFTVHSDGTAQLVDVADATKTLHRATWIPVDDAILSVSTAGSHLKGLVKGQMVNHGHTPAGPDGRVGLLIDGTGPVGVRSIEVIPISAH